MALILPLVLLLLVGIFDLGRAVYASHTIGNAARQAARMAIVDQTDGVADAVAREQAVALAITVDIAYWMPTPEDDPETNSACVPVTRQCIAVVKVTTDYQAATPIIGAIVGPLTLEARTEMPVERAHP